MCGVENKVLMLLLKNRRMLVDEILSQVGCSEDVLKYVLERHELFLRRHGLEIIVERPLELALLLIERGVEVFRVSELLDWRDFEKLSLSILREHGYDVIGNVKLTSPIRVEIDVVGVNPINGLALIIDCKHWSAMTRSRLLKAVKDHVKRLSKLTKYYGYFREKYIVFEKAKYVLPLVITLLTPSIRAYENVIVIGIRELNEFLLNTHLILDHYGVKPIKLGA
ncbi:MAG: restriction endonuclease [Desulfurococcaceae archaeon]